MSKQFDIYEVIANRMIAELEKGKIPWLKPWLSVSEGAMKHRNCEPYSLLNQILLGEPGEYLSFKECKEAGGKVKKGAKARMVVFWKWLSYDKKDSGGKTVFDEQGQAVQELIPYLRYSNVFHIKDCEGIEPRWKEPTVLNDVPADEKAEAALADYIARSGVRFDNVKQNRAYYSPSQDCIVVPLRGQFTSAQEYYSAVFHEATHSTGHPTRLCRFAMDSKAAAFGSEDYSKEELVAEIGAAAILHDMGMETMDTFRNSTAYVQSWLKALKDDKHLIVSAAGKADKAVRLILNLQSDQPEAI